MQTVTSFYTDVLGFKVSDWMGDRFSFLRCGADHHTVNFVRYEEARLHHIAFEVTDMAEVQRACDFLARNDIQLVWGPIRHVVGHNVAAYHRNPDDQRVEIVRRDGHDARRGARLFRAAALARGLPAAPEGVAGRHAARLLGFWLVRHLPGLSVKTAGSVDEGTERPRRTGLTGR